MPLIQQRVDAQIWDCNSHYVWPVWGTLMFRILKVKPHMLRQGRRWFRSGLLHFRRAGLVSDGLESFCQRCGRQYGDEKTRGSWNLLGEHRLGGEQSYMGFRMLLGFWWKRRFCQDIVRESLLFLLSFFFRNI